MDSTILGPSLDEEQLDSLTLGGYIREVCTRHAGREALVFHTDNGEVIRKTYDEVWEEALIVARRLVAMGLTKETRVAVLCTNRPEWISAVFGIALAGGVSVPLSTFAKAEELEYMLRISGASWLIFERSVLKRDFAGDLLSFCPELSAASHGELQSTSLPFLRGAICIDDQSAPQGAFESWNDFLAGEAKASEAMVDAIAEAMTPTDRGMIFFSSGTTSLPKAIVHTQRAPTLQCWRWKDIFAVDADVRTWAANGYFWSGNLCMAVGATFSAGGCLVMQRHFDPEEALKLMQEERVSLPIAWPHQWAQLVDAPGYAETDLSSLKYVGSTSPLREHSSVDTDWQEPIHAFGATETLTCCTIFNSGTPAEICEGTSGVPLAGNTIRIVDPFSGDIKPVGEAGEIVVKGPTLMLGYLGVASEDTFDAEGFFRTNDGGFVDEQGRLHWEGRLSDIIKTGGANVSPLEVDAVLRECPGVKVVATVGVPDDLLGELVVACVVPDEGVDLDEAGVRSYASERLSSFKVPRIVLMIEESDIEMSSSNKVKTGPLKELAAGRLRN